MTLPQIARAATTPNTEPSNCAATYGSIPAAGNTPNRHIANDIAGFVCPPLILPRGLLISPVSRTPTPSPTISSSTWICGNAREIAEGPTTNLTIVVTPKSRMEVRISSSALCRASSTDRDGPVAVILDSQNAKQSHPSSQIPFSPKTQRCAPQGAVCSVAENATRSGASIGVVVVC